jgi:hypothetical protein
VHVPTIKQLCTGHSIDELRAAEAALLEEQPLPIAVAGADEGEQLTHLTGAIWVLDRMKHAGADLNTALREFTQRVRNSIS